MATVNRDKRTSHVSEKIPRQGRADRKLRQAIRSPGGPEPSRVVQPPILAADRHRPYLSRGGVEGGGPCLSVPGGFTMPGGMPPIPLTEPTGRFLTFEEREQIALLRVQGTGVGAIARALGRDPGTISRELHRDAATRNGRQEYRATVAQWNARQAAARPKTVKLVDNPTLREYVQDRLAGKVRRTDSTVVAGPTPPPWKGLNKPHRADRR